MPLKLETGRSDDTVTSDLDRFSRTKNGWMRGGSWAQSSGTPFISLIVSSVSSGKKTGGDLKFCYRIIVRIIFLIIKSDKNGHFNPS